MSDPSAISRHDDPLYSDRVVAFIDILGFGVLVSALGTDPVLHRNLHTALRRIKRYKQSSASRNSAQSSLEVSVFSDSIVLSGTANDVHSVIWTAIHLQCDLLGLGVLIRGGISCGRTVHSDDVLYGEGMLAAYHLESRAAVYPRIAIDPKLVATLAPGYRAMFLDEDQDGLWFINPFAMGIVPPGADGLLEDGWNPTEISLKQLGKVIDTECSKLSDVAQLAKWGWLKMQHSTAVAELAKHGKPRFWRMMAEAEKLKGERQSTGHKP